jgi:hypothetical protein
MKAMYKHPWMQKYAHPGVYDHAFKHSVSRLGDHEVEVYPHTSSDRDATGVTRPKRFIRFQFYKNKVVDAHLFSRKEGDKDYHYMMSHKDD